MICKPEKNNICPLVYKYCEIHSDGNIYPCCPAYCNRYSFGNLNTDKSFYEIWNSTEAEALREKIVNDDYSLCNMNVCRHKVKFVDKDSIKEIIENHEYPTDIKICYDIECNVACIMCRNSICKNNEETLKRNYKYEEKILPIIDKIKELTLSGSGDPFGSRYCRELIKKVAKLNPNLIFNIHTNGILFTEKMAKDLGIYDRIGIVYMSIHAATEKMYNRIVKYSNFKLIKKNLEWLSKAKKKGKIKSIVLFFVINNFNYTEISDFVKMADKYGASANFSLCRDWGSVYTKDFSDIQIWKKEHPDHWKFLKAINNPIFKDKRILKEPNITNLYDSKTSWRKEKYKKYNRILKAIIGKYNL